MTQPHTQVVVSERPPCDFCKADGITTPAYYDAKLNFGTSWANMCMKHFNRYAISADPKIGLGLGKGQRLMTIMEDGSI